VRWIWRCTVARDPHHGAYPVRCCSMGSRKTAIVAATLLLACCGASAGIAGADPPPAPPEPKTTIDHDGRYSVGTDIVPGTYSSAGAVGSGTCYWKRLGGPNGTDIIDNALSSKPQVVQIEPSDAAFKTDGCQPWQMTDSVGPGGAPGDAGRQTRDGGIACQRSAMEAKRGAGGASPRERSMGRALRISKGRLPRGGGARRRGQESASDNRGAER